MRWLARFGMVVSALFFLVPFYWMLASALKTDQQLFAVPPPLIPNPPDLGNFPRALEMVPMGRYAVNTVVLALLVAVGHLISCPLAAYALARLSGRSRQRMHLATLAAFLLPFPALMVPQYLLYQKLGWINTVLPLVVPAFLGNPFYILYLRQTFLGFPRELEEAARLEGCSELQTLYYVVLPLCWPALAAVAVLTFEGVWNDFLSPLLYLQDQSMYTVTLGLQFYRSSHEVHWNCLMAATAMAAVPVVLLFLFAQRYFLETHATSGGK